MPQSLWKSFVVLALASAWGTFAPAADSLVTFSQHEVEFAATALETPSRPQTVILTNSGAGELTITSIAISGGNSADFTQTSNCPMAPATLAAAAHCAIRVVYKPTVDGGATASLDFSDNASGSPQSIQLTGHATSSAPGVSLDPPNLTFDNQPVNTASPVHVIVLTNTGSATLNINSSISISGPSVSEFRLQFGANSCPRSEGEIQPKSSCKIGILFSPATAGPKSAQITIIDDAPGSPQTISLSATATAPPQ
jgi:hypothetical protein